MTELTKDTIVPHIEKISSWLEEVKVSPSKPVPTFSGKEMILLIDSDIVAYRAAAACDGKYYLVGVPLSTGVQFKYHREAIAYCDEEEIDHKYIEPRYDPEPLAHATKNVDRIVAKIKYKCEDYFGRPVIMRHYFTHDKLFRDEIEPLYKSSRLGTRRPVHLASCKEFIDTTWGSTTTIGYEADDLIAIDATLLGTRDCCIVSLDKDLLQVPGLHFNFAKVSFDIVTEHSAKLNFWAQTMVGDKTDDIKGLNGVGPVGAKRVLEDIPVGATERDFYMVVLAKYIAHGKRTEEESEGDYLLRTLRELTKACKLLWLSRNVITPQWEIPID